MKKLGFKKFCVSVILLSLLGFGLFALPVVSQTIANFVQIVVGSLPSTINITNITRRCVNSGVTTLATGSAIPIPCDVNGRLSITTNATPGNIPTSTTTNGVAMTGSVQQLPSVTFANGNVFLENTGTTQIAIFSATGGVGGTCPTVPSLPWILYPNGDKLSYLISNLSAICVSGTAGTGGLVWTGN